jgi:GTP-binding protein
VLGVLEADERQLVLADIPGLIEGASEGAGLGHDFLAHVERTRLLVHVLDVAPELTAGEGADPLANHATIERELMAHDPRLAELPRVLALSKCDLLSEQRVSEAVAKWRERLGEEVPVIATSSATGFGLEQLSSELLRRVAPQAADGGGEGAREGDVGGLSGGRGGVPALVAAAGEGAGEDLAEHMVFRPAGRSGFSVERLGPKSFAVRGAGIERLLARYDVDNDDAMAYFEGRLRRIGVLKALEAEGFQAGDEIEIAGETFELDPSGP